MIDRVLQSALIEIRILEWSVSESRYAVVEQAIGPSVPRVDEIVLLQAYMRVVQKVEWMVVDHRLHADVFVGPS